MRTRTKQLIVTLAGWGWLPPFVALWMLRAWRLSDA
jgi:hypothetical protein